MNYKQCAKTLLSHENILILTHKNPDGDTMALSLIHISEPTRPY